MAYICMSCLREYLPYGLNLNDKSGYNSRCPSVDCGDLAVVEIDDIIAPVIKILNEKGYLTLYCCAGHYYDHSPNTYICFPEDYIPNSIPKGFVLEDRGYYEKQGWKTYNRNVSIRKYYKDRNNVTKDILSTAVELLDWANSLKCIE